MALIRMISRHIWSSGTESASLPLDYLSPQTGACPTQVTAVFTDTANAAYSVTLPLIDTGGGSYNGHNVSPSFDVSLVNSGGQWDLTAGGGNFWKSLSDNPCPPPSFFVLQSWDGNYGSSAKAEIQLGSYGTGVQMFRNSPAWDGPYVTNDITGTARCWCTVAPQSLDDPGSINATISGVTFDMPTGVCMSGTIYSINNINGTRTLSRTPYGDTNNARLDPPGPCQWFLRETAGLQVDGYGNTNCTGGITQTQVYDLIHTIGGDVLYGAPVYEMAAILTGYDAVSGSTVATVIFATDCCRPGGDPGPQGLLFALDCFKELTFDNFVGDGTGTFHF